mmetsp:Transcript_19939/g.28657  ORF Transcript_19939/g.28657 Transcript_19939/m.28657 type:complete len:184 (-) Transcript_19939:113-664(-)
MMSTNDTLSDSLVESEEPVSVQPSEENKGSSSRPPTQSEGQQTDPVDSDSDPINSLSPGFGMSLYDPKVFSEYADITFISCCVPCVPLASMKSSMEYRECSIVDCLFPPNVYQLRQQIRYRYLREDTKDGAVPSKPAPVDDDVMLKDCLVSCCCMFSPCAITQMAVELAQRNGQNPNKYTTIG